MPRGNHHLTQGRMPEWRLRADTIFEKNVIPKVVGSWAPTGILILKPRMSCFEFLEKEIANVRLQVPSATGEFPFVGRRL
jgi:hypothetical protein